MDGFICGNLIEAGKAGLRIIRDWGEPNGERSFTKLMYVHEILACLIDNTYALAKDRPPAISPEKLCYKVERRIERLVVYERAGDGPQGGRGLLRMEDNAEAKEARYEEVKWPKYIIAVRGTIVSYLKDIKANFKIVRGVACESPLFYGDLLNVLSLLHPKTSDSDGGTSDLDGGVWVTGHSLGAFMALTVTLRLAETKNIVLPTHLFHLPCVSPDVLLTKLVMGEANGLGTLYGAIPVVGSSLKYVCQRVGQVVTREVEEGVIHAITNVSPSTIANVRRRRKKLDDKGYMVHVYSNPRDTISNEFIKRSMRPGGLPTSLIALVQNAVFRDTSGDACHLIAPMILHTNSRGEGTYEAHKIKQWFLYKPVNHTSKRVELQD